MNAGDHLYLFLPLAILFSIGCNKEEDPPAPEQPVEQPEVFTTVKVVFTDTEPIGGVYETFELIHKDLDGAGGNDPVIVADTIPAGRYYNVSINLRNESVWPAVDLTSQVQAEATQHQFFFEYTDLALTISGSDLDANGKPLGLTFNVYTHAPSEGQLSITLRHDPDKDAEGVEAGDITNAGGNTDLEVEIPVILL